MGKLMLNDINYSGGGGDTIQYSTMPTASADNLGKIVQFIGTTTSSYTNGYFYKCVLNGSSYEWENINVSEGSGVIDGSTVTPTDDVSIWLECAGLHQSYTTLNEVLADSAVLSALMSSTNAVDYLVRSTTWASTICADETAMSCIGLNDYCADILLADSTWRTAICNSTYFEEVLNVKIPTQASASTDVTASSYYDSSYLPYMAFDNNDNTRWNGKNGVQNWQWIQYHFSNPVCVNKVYLKTFEHPTQHISLFKKGILQGSNDNTNWTNIQEIVLDSATALEQSYPINNETKYSYYRMYCTESYYQESGYYAYSFVELQFYGRGKSPVVDTKADISAIAPEEVGSTASRDYAVGEHFYKNGKFCTAKAAIAQGAQFTLGTNYVEGDIADKLIIEDFLSHITLNSNITWLMNNTFFKKIGKTVYFTIRGRFPASAVSGSQIFTLNEDIIVDETYSILFSSDWNSPQVIGCADCYSYNGLSKCEVAGNPNLSNKSFVATGYFLTKY